MYKSRSGKLKYKQGKIVELSKTLFFLLKVNKLCGRWTEQKKMNMKAKQPCWFTTRKK